MPHIDEMLGITTVAAAGLLVSIALQPLASGAHASAAATGARLASAPAPSEPADAELPAELVRSIDVVASRSGAPAASEREDKLARQRRTRSAQPSA